MKSKPGTLFLVLLLIEAALTFNCGQSSSITPVQPDAIVTVYPEAYAVTTDGTVQFSAGVTNSTDKSVTWSILSPSSNEGSIDSAGLYKAPSAGLPGPVTVEAEDVAYPSITATATVWVIAPGTVSTTNNPMVARYTITPPYGANVKVEFGPDTSYGLDTSTQTPPSEGAPVNILVAGMMANRTYHMRADIALPGGAQFVDADHTFQTQGPSPTQIPPMTVTTPNSNLTPSPGVELLDLVGTSVPSPLHVVATDMQGNLIWYYSFDDQGGNLICNPIKLLPNGHLMAVIGVVSDKGVGNTYDNLTGLREIDLAGNTIRQILMPELNQKLSADLGVTWTALTMHHDFVYIPEGPAKGHVIVIVNHVEDINGNQMLGDALVDLDQNFNPVWVWDSFDHLNTGRNPFNGVDWTHANGLAYSPDDGNLLLSMRNQSWVIKIDYEDGMGNGKVLWRFGYQGDFTMQNGGSSQWAYGQHYPIILSPNSTGTFKFGVFDDGNFRVFDNGTVCGSAGAAPCYSRIPIYSIDETNKTVQVLWQDNLSPVFAPFLGSMQVMKNNDVNFDIGAYSFSPQSARVLEVTQETPPQVVWQLDETGQFAYRVIHMPSLYPGVQW